MLAGVATGAPHERSRTVSIPRARPADSGPFLFDGPDSPRRGDGVRRTLGRIPPRRLEAGVLNTEGLRLALGSGVEEEAALGGRLVLRDRDAVGVRKRVLPNAGHLPGDLDARFVGFDREAVSRDLPGDDRLCKLTDDGQLVAEIAVERGEVVGKLDDGIAVGVRRHVAVVHV